jgi:glycosyltransferase involved in cell wall biosynthesis
VRRAFGHDNVVVIPNAIDLPGAKAVPSGQTLLFLGLLSYHPNTVAADHLIRNIWPKVLSVLPQARLLIAGARPENLASYEQRPKGVTFVGFVDDLDKLYDEVTVVCCPMLHGSGTRIKILEAAAYGRPVVSTTLGAEGLRLKDGEEILLRDDPGSFAEACVRLLTDGPMAARMGRKARLVVEQEHERQLVVEKIRKFVARAPASIRGPDALCR